MLELLQTAQNLVVGLLHVAWNLVGVVAVFLGDTLYHLHVNAPRLEGLLAGVTLAWLLRRQSHHPLLRIASAPLQLVLDILDLAWNQCVGIVRDAWSVVRGWTYGILGWCWQKVTGVLGWCWQKVTGVCSWVLDVLRGLKERLGR